MPKLQPQPKIENGKSRDKIITQIYNRKDIRPIIKRKTWCKDDHEDGYLAEELESMLYFDLCKMEEAELIEIYQKGIIDGWILEYLDRQTKSKTSPFYRKIKKFETGKAFTEDQIRLYEEELNDNLAIQHSYLDELEKAIDDLQSPGEYTHYHKDIVKLHLEHKTIKKVSEVTGIRPSYISEAVRDAKQQLKSKITTQLNNNAGNDNK